MIEPERARGALLGAAIGDALGMPVEGLSHQNVRTYYRGIKDLRADEKRRDLAAGQWTARTQALLALSGSLASGDPLAAPALSSPRRAPAGDPPAGWAIAAASALGIRWAVADWLAEDALRRAHDGLAFLTRQPATLAAAFGQALAVRSVLGSSAPALDGPALLAQVAEGTAWAEQRLGSDDRCSARLARLAPHVDEYPLDLQDRCGGTGFAADEAWPFALAMFARRPELVEASLLSAVNVGGDAPTVGACLGALLGALHGAGAFPPGWRELLEGHDAILAAADALLGA